ncbi:hypothetical protein JHK87_018501 [Glycine soja]|nr:hypothetical protein JHK87_018501 [Glycine soja]
MTGLTSSQGYNFSAFVYSWKGVCSDANREHVVDLVFSGIDLSATIADNTIGKLGKLIDLSSNNLSGEIPEVVISLLSLRVVKLDQNLAFPLPIKKALIVTYKFNYIKHLISPPQGESLQESQFHKGSSLNAPVIDSALVTLFCGWACKVRNEGLCLSSGASGCCPAQRLSDIKENIGWSSCACASALSNSHVLAESGLAVSSNNLGLSSLSTAKSLQSLSFSSSASSLNSNLFIWEIESSSCNVGSTQRPIDTIFKFHKVIRKDLEYLDVESRKLNDGDEKILWQFNGRFRLLWDLYRAHSNVEDEIVFPALESKEALHNVSHSYMLDHKQEEQLFEDISYVLSEFFVLHEVLQMTHIECWKESPVSTTQTETLDHITSQRGAQMFKLGWKDIFRMNHNELESKIRKLLSEEKAHELALHVIAKIKGYGDTTKVVALDNQKLLALNPNW